MLTVFLEGKARPRREYTGLDGVGHRHLTREGGHYTVTAEGAQSGTEWGAWDDLVTQLQPLIRDWHVRDRAILTLRLQGHTVREIRREVGTSPNHVCKVIQEVRDYLGT